MDNKHINKTCMICLVGAGGKSTISEFLAEFLNRQDKRILITTTTKIYNPDGKGSVYVGDIKKLIPTMGIIFAGQYIMQRNDKLVGYTIDELDDLYRLNVYDYIIIEADGARERSIKAPNETEPVIPNCTDLIIGVVGLDSIEKAINDENVHRPELFCRVTESSIGDVISINHILKLINHKEGLFRNCSEYIERLVILNKSDVLSIDVRKDIINTIKEYNSNNKILITSILNK